MKPALATVGAFLDALLTAAAPAGADQTALVAKTAPIAPILTFDWPALSFGIGSGRYATRLAFTTTGSRVAGAVLNPGRWEQSGVKLDPRTTP